MTDQTRTAREVLEDFVENSYEILDSKGNTADNYNAALAALRADLLGMVGNPRPEDSYIYSSRKLREMNGLDATNKLKADIRQRIEEYFK